MDHGFNDIPKIGNKFPSHFVVSFWQRQNGEMKHWHIETAEDQCEFAAQDEAEINAEDKGLDLNQPFEFEMWHYECTLVKTRTGTLERKETE